MKIGLKINKGKIFFDIILYNCYSIKGDVINEFEKNHTVYILLNDSSQDGIFQ